MLLVVFWPRGLALDEPFRHIAGLEDWYESVFLMPAYWAIAACGIVLYGTGRWRPRLVGWSLVVLLLPLIFLDGLRQSRQTLLTVLAACSLLGQGGPMWPIRLAQLQLALIYGVNAIAKSSPEYFSGETLVGMSQTMGNFLVDLSSGYLEVGPVRMPAQLAAVLSALTEYGLALGFWFRRTRVLAAVAGVGFHMVLKFIVRIHMLDWVSMFLYLLFFLPFERRTVEAKGG